MADAKDLVNIGTFSLITRLSKRALRLYDEKGLLVPAKKELTAYRYYSGEQIVRGLRIRWLSELGFGISEMKDVLEALDAPDGRKRLETLFGRRLEQVEADIRHLQGVRKALTDERSLEMIPLEKLQPSVKEVPGIRVVSRREKGTYAEAVPRLITEICAQIANPDNQKAGARFAGPPMLITHDMSYKEKDADIEVAVPVLGRISAEDRYEVKNLEGGRMASVMHRGSYGKIGASYSALFEYLGKNGLQPAGPCRELYLTDPKTSPESEWLTEIQLPVRNWPKK